MVTVSVTVGGGEVARGAPAGVRSGDRFTVAAYGEPLMDADRYRVAERRLWAHHGLAPAERRLELRRTGASVRVQEVGDGPPVILIHGASNSAVSWAPLLEGLAGFRCIAVDRPGCGLSDPVPKPLGDTAALAAFGDAFLADVLDALDLPTAHVVGTSFGGFFSLRHAAAHPDRVGRMVLFGWSVGAPTRHLPLVMRVGSIPALSRMTASMPVNVRMVRAMFRSIGLRQALDAGRVSDELAAAYVALLRHTDTMRNEVAALPRVIHLRGGMDEGVLLSDDLLASVVAPVRMLWGEGDPMGGRAEATAFGARLRTAELEVLAGAGHAPWIDEPEHAATTTAAFLSR